MKLLLLVLLTLAGGAALASLIIFDKSYVNITVGSTQLFENNLTVFVLLLVAAIMVVFYTLKLLKAIFNAPDLLGEYSYKRKKEAAQNHLKQGFVDFIECRWASAEKHFIKGVAYGETPLINYLGAARAAAQQNKLGTSDEYIRQAEEASDDSRLAILLTQAEIALDHEYTQKAVTLMNELKALAPKHAYVIKLESRLYYQLKDWGKLSQLLPKLKKNKLFKPEQLARLELEAGQGLINTAGMQFSDEALNTAWSSLPSVLKKDARIVSVYVAALLAKDEHKEAEALIREALNKHWSESLIEQYSEVKFDSSEALLSQCKKWARDYPNSPKLLLALARFSSKERLFDEAIGYYQASLDIEDSASVQLEYASLLDSMGKNPPIQSHAQLEHS